MSVNPGFGGQSFIDSALPKTRACRALLDRFAAETGRHIDLEIDGGVKPDNVAAIAEAGAEVLVAGSAVFSQGDYAAALAAIRAGAEAGAARRRGA
jgi:ribulose-phosphate 3-epimerase